MPVILDPNATERMPSTAFGDLRDVSYDYSYPRGLDLKPGSDFHETLRQRLWQRAYDGRRMMAAKFNDWRETDATLRAYVPAEHHALKEDDSDDPLERIIMPATFANLETLLTYMVSAFLQTPIFTYEGQGPEDSYGAFLLTQHIAQQCHRSKVGLALHTQWRDAFAYGFGVVSPVWFRRFGTRLRAQEGGYYSEEQNQMIVTERRRKVERGVLWEGNKLENIDPYRYLPDPTTPIHKPQEAEYHGWITEENLLGLLGRERDPDDYLFNVQYLKHINGTSSFGTAFLEQREKGDGLNYARSTASASHPVDVIVMYVNLIPADWELGSSEYPEKWLFALGGDQVIIAAQPMDLYHDMFPVVTAAPDFDGYSPVAVSRLEIVSDLQRVIDFLYSSHIANVRKAINDMLVVDPSLVNIYDLNTPKPGKIVRMRRSAWGRGGIDAAIKQLDVRDVTSGHVQDTMFLSGFMQQVLGASENLQGVIPQRRGERISASEAQGARFSGLARLERIARLISMQSMQDIAYQFAMNTQQLASKEMYVKVMGEHAERLAQQYGKDAQGGRILVDPMDMLFDVDVKELDGTVPGSESAETWMQLLQIASQSPELMQRLNLPSIFTHIARHLGAKNVDDFILKAEQARPQVMPTEEVLKGYEAGNLVPAPMQPNGSAL